MHVCMVHPGAILAWNSCISCISSVSPFLFPRSVPMEVACCSICGRDVRRAQGWGCGRDSTHKMHRWCRSDVISSSAIDIPIISSISLAGFYLDIWSIWNHWNLYYFYFLNIWSIFNMLIYLISFVFDVFDVFVYFIYLIYLWYLWIFISFVFFVVGLLHLMHLHIYCY